MIDLLAAMGFVVALGYWTMAATLIFGPFRFPKLRELGGIVRFLRLVFSIFFLSCGVHHLMLALHMETREIDMSKDAAHFLVTDTIQAICVFAAAFIIIFNWRDICVRITNLIRESHE